MRVHLKRQTSPVKTLVVITALIAVCSYSPAEARRGDYAGHLAKELNLTPEQKEQLTKINEEFRATVPEKRKQMKAAREELQKTLQSDASDDVIRQKFQELQKKQGEFAAQRFEKVLSIRKLLTPEQRQKFKGVDKHDFWSKHRGKRGGASEKSDDAED